jgi:hypothetical protein
MGFQEICRPEREQRKRMGRALADRYAQLVALVIEQCAQLGKPLSPKQRSALFAVGLRAAREL